jgi:hypothetical protein
VEWKKENWWMLKIRSNAHLGTRQLANPVGVLLHFRHMKAKDDSNLAYRANSEK